MKYSLGTFLYRLKVCLCFKVNMKKRKNSNDVNAKQRASSEVAVSEEMKRDISTYNFVVE